MVKTVSSPPGSFPDLALARHAAGPLWDGCAPVTVLSWARRFPGTPEQVHSARRFVADQLLRSPLRDDAVIVLSELFTNAVLHTRSGRPGGLVTVRVSWWRVGAQVAVTDQGSASEPVISEPAASGQPAESGNGLLMVSRLATRLYWRQDKAGRTSCAILGALPDRGQDPGAGGAKRAVLTAPAGQPGAPAPAAESGRALKVLIDELAACGLPPSSITLTRRQATLVLPDGRVIRCARDWLGWLTGRASCQGRPLYTVHSLHDAAGAARRLARAAPWPGGSGRADRAAARVAR